MKKQFMSFVMILLITLTMLPCAMAEASIDAFDIIQEFDILSVWGSSLSEKAALSDKWIQIVQVLEANDPCFSSKYPNLYAFTRHRYGMPTSDHIQLETALETAKHTAVAMGASLETYSDRRIEYLFDVTDATHPIWKIIILSASVSRERYPQSGNYLRFRVDINAETGEVENAYIIEPQMPVLDWRL